MLDNVLEGRGCLPPAGCRARPQEDVLIYAEKFLGDHGGSPLNKNYWFICLTPEGCRARTLRLSCRILKSALEDDDIG